MALGKGYLEGGAAQSPIFRGLTWAAAAAAVGHGTAISTGQASGQRR